MKTVGSVHLNMIGAVKHAFRGNALKERAINRFGRLAALSLAFGFIALCAPGPARADEADDDTITDFEQIREHARDRAIMAIFPHQDDEVASAPMLRDLVEKGSELHLLWVKRNNWLRHRHMHPDIRRQEGACAAEKLGAADWYYWDDIDVDSVRTTMRPLEETRAQWEADAGGHDALMKRYHDLFDRIQPAVIFCHDPRHGDYGHSDHMVTGMHVLEAVETYQGEKPVVVLRQWENTHNPSVRPPLPRPGNQRGGAWNPDDPGLFHYDASTLLEDGRESLVWLAEVTSCYPSQISEDNMQRIEQWIAVSRVMPRLPEALVPISKNIPLLTSDAPVDFNVDLRRKHIPPLAPTDLTVTRDSETGDAEFAWTPNSRKAEHLDIQRRSPGGEWQPLATLDASATSFIDPNPPPRAQYRLRNRSWEGESNWTTAEP